ncbi:efflux RND transporter periplasmic adaptor subunit [Tundrisphaera lichenicola]|uniref:efflux RND transporter periplasmic adaptor subunit n=1 Tax=Tundrisphaera lichenicola TaxID=2029860 RepID=UPI003EBCB237
MSRREIWIAAILGSSMIAGCAKPKPKPVEPPPPEVLVTRPVVDEVTDYEEFIGHTEAVFSVEVRARVTGYLDKVNFNDGDEVEKGTLLFEIDARPYTAEADRAEATLRQGEARLTRLAADHRRADTLFKKGAIGLEEYDRINGDYAEGMAAIGVATAAVDLAKLNLDFTRVTAPIGGRLSRRMVDPGNLVKADETPLTTIVSLDPMHVYFDIDERTMLKIRRLIAEGRIQSRKEVEFPVLVGLSDEADFPHKGLINFSDNKVDSSTGTLRVRGVISNPKPRILSPGLFVRIRLPIGKPHRSLMISEQAVGSEQTSRFVYVIRKSAVKDKKSGKQTLKDVAFAQPIEVGSLTKGLRVVNKGLTETDLVVVGGLQRIRNGAEVTLPKPKPNDSPAVAQGPPAIPEAVPSGSSTSR